MLSSDPIANSLHYYYYEEGFLLSWKFGFFFSGRVFFSSFSYACQRPFLTLSPAMSGDIFLRIVFEVFFIYVLWEAQAIGDETLVLFLIERERLGVNFYFSF